MYQTFSQFYGALNSMVPVTIAVAAAHDEAILQAVKDSCSYGYAKAILIGDYDKIESMVETDFFNYPIEVINEKDEIKAAEIAVNMVKSAEADFLMKGMINSSEFLKVVLNQQSGLRTGNLLSHLAAFEIPNINKLSFYTDGGMNTYPDLKAKKDIVINGINALHSIGIKTPKVAVLTANEQISPKMPSTVDAAALVKMFNAGELPDCILEGPIALDVALSKEAANHKGIYSEISGDVDLFIVPNIEVGNMIGKALMYYAKAKMAGVILGAACPIVLTSRAENAEGKRNSIAFASLIHNNLSHSKGEII